MRLNFDREPFADPDFRRAVALAINPKEILQRVALGQGVVGPFPAPSSPWTDPSLRLLSDDPRTAAAILDKKGFRDRNGDGFREDSRGAALRLSVKVSSSEPLHQRAAEVVARQLQAVGLDVRVEVIDPARARALSSSRQFDMLIDDVTPHNLADPDQLMQSVLYGYLWREGHSYPELDVLLKQWREASTIETRVRACFALQQLHNKAPVVLILYYPQSRFAFRSGAYKNWRPIPGLGVFHKWSLIDFYGEVPAWARQ
jgi:peptide/nickel transport system substrate-binding protein